ncbi:hypothetical protein Taro_009803 [Colocasia esculenta]|uniref:Uncharacterized protein n=1 Tax=Colocasia esculenta TaxID=4460 RepID=A0A843U7M4_COLES|nr:hypothetical protein [Colocasia esculenta]
MQRPSSVTDVHLLPSRGVGLTGSGPVKGKASTLLAPSVRMSERPCALPERLIFMRPAHPYPHWGGYVEQELYLFSQEGPFKGQNPKHEDNTSWEAHLNHVSSLASSVGRCSHGSRTILLPEHREQGDEISPITHGVSPSVLSR